MTQARARRGETSVQIDESNVAGYDKTGRRHRIKLHCSSNKSRKRDWIFMPHSTPDNFQATQFVCLTRSMVWLFKAFWKPPFYYTHYYWFSPSSSHFYSFFLQLDNRYCSFSIFTAGWRQEITLSLWGLNKPFIPVAFSLFLDTFACVTPSRAYMHVRIHNLRAFMLRTQQLSWDPQFNIPVCWRDIYKR